MEQSLAELVRTQRISRDTAYAHTGYPEDLSRHLGESGIIPQPNGCTSSFERARL